MNRCVWFGLHAPEGAESNTLIEVIPLSFEEKTSQIKQAEGVVFTSKTAVQLFCPSFSSFLQNKVIVATGKATAQALRYNGIHVHFVPKNESQEGLVKEVFCHTTLSWFWPKSKQARSSLQHYFASQMKSLIAVDFYEISYKKSRLPYEELLFFSSFVFTSPSTVDSYFSQFHAIPPHVQVYVQGEVTREHFLRKHALFGYSKETYVIKNGFLLI